MNAVRTAEHLDPALVRLEVVALQQDGPLRARYDRAGIPVHAFPIRNLYGPSAIRQGARLARLLRGLAPDVVHCHDIYSNVFTGFWARVAGVPHVIASRRWGLASSRPRLDRLNRIFSRHAARLLTNSASVGEHLVRHERYRAERLAVVPNFLEPAAFEQPTAAAVAARRRELGIPEDRWIIGVVARLTPVKDHATLVQAVTLLTARARPWHIVLVGEGPERHRLEELALTLGVGDRVTFAGTLPNRPNPHGLFDVSVLTSRSEGFPNSVIEAMAVARPVVATRVGGVSDAVLDGETGLLVPPGDPRALAYALEQLAADDARAARLGAAGRDRAAHEFAMEVVLSRLIAVYRELAA